MKPPPEKIMVKRDVEKKLSFLNENDINIDDNEEETGRSMDMPLMRNRRSVRMLHGPAFAQNQLSPLSITYAENYNEEENKGWVKPLFSSIVYRLPVSYKL